MRRACQNATNRHVIGFLSDILDFRLAGFIPDSGVANYFWLPGRIITMTATDKNYGLKKPKSLNQFSFIYIDNLKFVERIK